MNREAKGRLEMWGMWKGRESGGVWGADRPPSQPKTSFGEQNKLINWVKESKIIFPGERITRWMPRNVQHGH